MVRAIYQIPCLLPPAPLPAAPMRWHNPCCCLLFQQQQQQPLTSNQLPPR